MRSNRLWIGVTCGVALALGGVVAVDAGTQTAGAAATCPDAANPNCPQGTVNSVTPSPARADRNDDPFTVSIDQHVIDQRIASAGVTRSNRALKGKLARGQRQLWARLNPTMVKITAQSGPASGAGSFTFIKEGVGIYRVDFKREVSACSWSATPFFDTVNADARAAVTAFDSSRPTEVMVNVFTVAGTPTDTNVDVQVLC